MKKTLLPLASLVLGTTAYAQVENGNFEDWDKRTFFEQPFMGIDAVSSNHEIFIETGETNVTRSDREDGSAVRLESILIGDRVEPAFYLLGGVPNQVSENLVFSGGFAASDPNINAISVDMTYDFPEEASGIVIVQFKIGGEPVGRGNSGVGTFVFPVSGQQDWENKVFDFGTTIDVQFDQVVIGFATADYINEDSNFPEGSWMEVDNLSLINSSDEVSNGDFEVWAQAPPVFVPVNVEVEIDLINPTFIKSEDASGGQFALGLMTRDMGGVAEASTAKLGKADSPGGIPTISLPEDLAVMSFDYKYAAAADVAEMEIIFYEQSGESLIPVYGKVFELSPNTSFETIEFAFREELESNFVSADKMSITVYSSKESANPEANSLLLLDNVKMFGALSSRSGIKQTATQTIVAYPNPTLGRVVFEFGTPRSGSGRIYNNQGVAIGVFRFNETRSYIYDLYGMEPGYYMFRFYHEEGVETSSILKI